MADDDDGWSLKRRYKTAPANDPKPCHVLSTIPLWNITGKPFSFASLQWRYLWMLLEMMIFQKGCQELQHLMALLRGNLWVRGNTYAKCLQGNKMHKVCIKKKRTFMLSPLSYSNSSKESFWTWNRCWRITLILSINRWYKSQQLTPVSHCLITVYKRAHE